MIALRPASRIAAPALLLLLATGCAGWPEPGRGGMAEHHAPAPATESAVAAGAALDRRLARVEELRAAGLERRAPARLAELTLMAARIRREVSADLTDDARLDLHRLDGALEVVERLIGIPTPHIEAAR